MNTIEPGIGHNQPPLDTRTYGGYIKVYRDIRTHPIVGHALNVKPADPKRGSANRGEAWQDLIMEASYEGTRRRNHGREVWLEAGDLMAAHKYLAERWNWTVKQVRRFLDLLESEGMIVRPKIAAPKRATKGQPKGNQPGNLSGTQTDNQKGNQNAANGSVRYRNEIQVIRICNYLEFQRYDYAMNEANRRIAEAFEEEKGQPNGHLNGQPKGQTPFHDLARNGQQSNKEERNNNQIASSVPCSAREPEDGPSREIVLAGHGNIDGLDDRTYDIVRYVAEGGKKNDMRKLLASPDYGLAYAQVRDAVRNTSPSAVRQAVSDLKSKEVAGQLHVVPITRLDAYAKQAFKKEQAEARRKEKERSTPLAQRISKDGQVMR